MKIKSLTLYKTSLDEFYHNVIDADPDESINNTTYKEVILDAYYSPYVIYNNENGIKSFIEENGIITLSIAKVYEDIMEGGYNYCAIDTGSKYIFYFVSGCRSYNDGNNPSMQMTIKRDCWANNIEYFTNQSYTDNNAVIRSHWRRWYTSGGMFYPYYRTSGDVCNFRSINEVGVSSIHGETIGIIWCGFRVSAGSNVEGSGALAVFDKPWMKGYFGGAPLESSSMPLYFPLFAYTIDNNGVPTIDGRITFGGTYRNPEDGSLSSKSVSYDYLNQNGNGQRQLGFSMYFAGDWCDEAFLTTIPPFEYTVTGSLGNVTVTLDNAVCTDGYISAKDLSAFDTNAYNFYGELEGVKKQLYVASVAGNDINLRYTKSLSIYDKLDGFSTSSSIGSSLFDVNADKDSTLYYEPRIYCEPYRIVNIRVGDVKQQVDIHETGTMIRIDYNAGLRSEPSCNIYVNGNPVTENVNIGNMGSLPTFKVNGSTGSNLGLGLLTGMMKAGVNFALTKDAVSSAAEASNDIINENFKSDNRLTYAKLGIYGGSMPTERQMNDYKYGMTANTVKRDNALERANIDFDIGMADANRGLTQSLYDSSINTIQQMPSLFGGGLTSKTVSNLASNNYTYFNPVISISKWADNGDIEGVLNDMYMYGYKRNTAKSVKENCRTWFDFCQTSSCSLPEITNYMDRNILEQAFNRGVTKWHWGPLGLQSNFNKNINNIEREWIKTEDAPLSYKFFKSQYPLVNYGTIGDVSVCTLNGGEIVNGIGLTGRAKITNVPGMVNSGYGQVWQFKLTQLPSNWQTQFIELVGTNARTGYGPNQAYGITVNGDFGSKQGGNSSTLCTMPNGINDFLNKTITVYARSEGGSYYFTKTRIFVDDVMIFDGYGGNGFADNATLDLMYNCDGIMRAFRAYKLPYDEIWDSEIVARHLL